MPDLHLGPDTASTEERAAIAEIVDRHGPAVLVETERFVRGGLGRARDRRHLVLPALHALRDAVGWISPGGLQHLCAQLHVPPAEAYGVATFYDMFRVEQPQLGPPLHVCIDPICQVAGAERIAADAELAGRDVERGPCLGQCDRGPACFEQRPSGDVATDAAGQPFATTASAVGGVVRVLARVGRVDPSSLRSYRDNGGYVSLERALALGPRSVLDLVEDAGLLGRGGASFPVARKWRAVAAEPGPRHLIANVDESEPGTFKDRVLVEADPFALVESLTIAGLTIGATQGWMYVRGEYPVAEARVRSAIDQARAAGLLGSDVAGSGQAFDIEVRRGAGAYICGEETALINSIEGFRGEPRNKPPFPATDGLFGRPTAVNNPETLVNVLDIVRDGAAAFRSRGTERSPGTRLFALSGAVGRPGVYEADFGTPLDDLIELAGGVAGSLQAVLLGGAAGAFVPLDQLDTALSIEGVSTAGLTIGSGAVMVFDDSADMPAVVGRIAQFFAGESCGQCVPCRIGTRRQHEVLVEVGRDEAALASHRELLVDLDAVMADASICGLGHTASHAVRSAIDLGLLGADR